MWCGVVVCVMVSETCDGVVKLAEVLGTGVNGSLGGYSGFLWGLHAVTTVHGFSDEKTVESYLPDPDNLLFYNLLLLSLEDFSSYTRSYSLSLRLFCNLSFDFSSEKKWYVPLRVYEEKSSNDNKRRL